MEENLPALQIRPACANHYLGDRRLHVEDARLKFPESQVGRPRSTKTTTYLPTTPFHGASEIISRQCKSKFELNRLATLFRMPSGLEYSEVVQGAATFHISPQLKCHGPSKSSLKTVAH